MSLAEPDHRDQMGQEIPFHLTPGIVIASFFVSLIGTTTTVELLHRRTNGQRWANWIQLFACSVSMGLIGIWCMHYVGNRAIVLGNGEPSLQLVYSPGITAASSFIPIASLFVAYLVADLRYRGRKVMAASLIFSGISAGLAIVGMHYVGNIGVSNYNIAFKPAYVGGAIAIACFGCVVALTLLFMLQELWISRLAYRLVCAVVLAGAVSGMHFEASMGTTYYLKSKKPQSDPNARNINVIIATILSLLTIPACAAIAVSVSRRRKQLADRAQEVILACVRFDPDGKLMVTHEGLLPCQKITAKHNQRSFEDEFNVSHPAFQWIFRVSHNWMSVSKWIPGMRSHLLHINRDVNYKPKKGDTPSSRVLGEPIPQDEDYSIIFRESFCVAAADLATSLRMNIMELGWLFDGVMMTGTLNELRNTRSRSMINKLTMNSRSALQDLEARIGLDLFGKGQLLFLVKQIDKKHASNMMSQGYRFVAIDKIQTQLAHTMQVSLHTMATQLSDLRTYAFSPPINLPSGTLLACFALRAGISKHNWEVLTQKDHPAELPAVQLAPFCLGDALEAEVKKLEGKTVSSCIDYLSSRINATDEESTAFLRHLRKCILDLVDMVPESWFRQAVFSAKTIMLPVTAGVCRHDVESITKFGHASGSSSSISPLAKGCNGANLYAFHIIPDIHSSSLKSAVSNAFLEYSPLSFFRCRQQVLFGTPQRAHHLASFERRMYQEFAPIFSRFSHASFSEMRRNDQIGVSGRASPFNHFSRRDSISGESTLPPSSSHSNNDRPPSWLVDNDNASRQSSRKGWLNNKIAAALSPRKEPELCSSGHLLALGSEKADSIYSRTRSQSESYGMNTMPYGGIMVSSDITVEHEGPKPKKLEEIDTACNHVETAQRNTGFGPQAALQQDTRQPGVASEAGISAPFGTTGHASVVDTEEPTFVDDLVKVAVGSLKRM